MIGIELIRSDPERVRRAIEARGDSAPIDRVLELDEQRRRTVSEVDDLRAARNQGSARLSKMNERPPRTDRRDARIGLQDQDARGESQEHGRGAPRAAPEPPEHPGGRRARRPRRVGERLRARRRGRAGFRLRAAPALGAGRASRHHRLQARRKGVRIAVLRAQGQGRAAPEGADRVDARPARVGPRLRGAVPAQHRHPGDGRGKRPAPQVPRQHVPRRRGRPVADPHGRGADHQSLRRGDTVGGRPAEEVRGPYAVLQAREGGGRQGHARDQAIAPVREGGDVQDRGAGALFRRAGEPVGRRRGRLQASGHRAPGDAAVHRGHGVRGRPDLRRGDVGAWVGRVAGGELVLGLRGLPGEEGERPVPAAGGRQAAVRAHAERLGTWRAADADSDPGELPAGRRLRGGAQRSCGRTRVSTGSASVPRCGTPYGLSPEG